MPQAIITFGNKVTATRKGLKLSQTELATQLATSVFVKPRYTRGEMSCSIDNAPRLAEALGTSIAYLLGDPGDDDLLANRELVRRPCAV